MCVCLYTWENIQYIVAFVEFFHYTIIYVETHYDPIAPLLII